MAANAEPSINDITYEELLPLLEAAGNLDESVLGWVSVSTHTCTHTHTCVHTRTLTSHPLGRTRSEQGYAWLGCA